MEGPRNKLLVWLILLATVVIASVVLSVVIASNYYKGEADTGPWTPMPTPTETSTVQPPPTQTATQPGSPTPKADPVMNCTHSVTYWANHSEAWPAQVVIANLSYTKEEAAAAYNTQSGDVATDLFVQLQAAFLNYLNGADTAVVNNTIVEAANWLNVHPVGSQPGESDQQTAITLGITLADYNNGIIGPGQCADEVTRVPATEIVLPTATISQTVTTSTMIPTRRPTRIPTESQGAGHPPANPPANTPTPLPTNTPVTPPSATPAPTKIIPPTPVPTQIIPPTPASTQLSTPTPHLFKP